MWGGCWGKDTELKFVEEGEGRVTVHPKMRHIERTTPMTANHTWYHVYKVTEMHHGKRNSVSGKLCVCFLRDNDKMEECLMITLTCSWPWTILPIIPGFILFLQLLAKTKTLRTTTGTGPSRGFHSLSFSSSSLNKGQFSSCSNILLRHGGGRQREEDTHLWSSHTHTQTCLNVHCQIIQVQTDIFEWKTLSVCVCVPDF